MKSSQRYHKSRPFYDDSTQSKLSEEFLPFFGLHGLIDMRKKLGKKYDNSTSAIGLKYVNDILKGVSKRSVIKFRDFKNLDQQKEHLQQMYTGSQVGIKFQQTIGFYVFYEDIPRLFIDHLAIIVSKKIQQHRIIKYRALKNTLGIQEQLQQKSNKLGSQQEMSKFIPTKIFDQQTQNSMQSIVKQLSILITKHNDMMKRNAVTQGCFTLLRTNKKKLNKLLTLQQTKSKPHKSLKRNQSTKNQTINSKQKRMSRQLSSKQRKPSSRCLSSKSKRFQQSNKKSVQQLLRLHNRQKTRSPQGFKEQKIKKKHIRQYSSQQQQLYSFKQNNHLKRISHDKKISAQNICILKPKMLKKNKVKYQN